LRNGDILARQKIARDCAAGLRLSQPAGDQPGTSSPSNNFCRLWFMPREFCGFQPKNTNLGKLCVSVSGGLGCI
jgi:hypothetical protein